MKSSINPSKSPPFFDYMHSLPSSLLTSLGVLPELQSFWKMGQSACCESDANNPNQVYDNSKPITTPPRSTRRSNRNTTQSPSKYTQTILEPNLSAYVKDKMKQLGRYDLRNSSRVKGEPRSYFLIESSETIYKGEWKDNQPHGIGELFFKDGSYYFGTFAHGFAHGDGRYIFSKGSYYEGQVRHNVAEGKGILVNQTENYTYSGEWLNDLPNGTGEQKWKDGTEYRGDFLNGSKHGKGFYKFPDGSTYEGYFKQDMFQGQGKMTLPKGEYVGSFVQGRMQGRGVFTWKDQSTYEGQYKNNKKHGRGRYISAEGKSYEGDWQNGLRQGNGNLTNQLGEVKSLKWNRGELFDDQ